jgi:hypothetical protein
MTLPRTLEGDREAAGRNETAVLEQRELKKKRPTPDFVE